VESPQCSQEGCQSGLAGLTSEITDCSFCSELDTGLAAYFYYRVQSASGNAINAIRVNTRRVHCRTTVHIATMAGST
jgi:hypothetical protein